MRVLVWSELYWPHIGGAEIFVSRLMASLREAAVEFLVVTSHHDQDLPDEDVHDGVKILRLPFRAAIAGRDVKSFLRATEQTAAIKREFAPDLIHVNAIGPSTLFHLRTAAASTAPVLVTVQQEVLASQVRGSATLMAQVIDSAAWVVGVSDAVLQQLRAAHSIAARSSRIYNGIDRPALEPAPLPEIPHLLCLGRLVHAKGFDVALRAFALLAPHHPEIRFTVAGDGAAREELTALAVELGVETRVVFTGWIAPDDVPSLLNEASIVVMPSRREGLPLVAVQAALMARPLIATTAGGLPEVVIDGSNGILVPGEDPRAVAQAIEELLGDRSNAAAMGERGRGHVQSVLGWQRTVSSYHALYLAMAGKTATDV